MGIGSSSVLGAIEPTDEVTFTINEKSYTVKPDGVRITATTRLSTFIRDVAHLKGTKLMCLEGGCGSCMVAVQCEHPVTKRACFFSVNSCLVTILSCHGWKITTIEGVGNKMDGYHEIQTRLAKFNGTQCGFCSPAMVMNMFALNQSDDQLTQKQIENSFGGNNCRCTGYRPIADAFKSLAIDAEPRLLAKCADMEDLNVCLKKKSCVEISQVPKMCFLSSYVKIDIGDEKWFKVYNLVELLEVLNVIGDAKYMLVAGNTAHGVRRRDTNIEVYIDIRSVKELHELTVGTELIIGANTSLTETMKIFTRVSNEKEEFIYLKEIVDHLDLVANVPVRNIGTIAGNLTLKHSFRRFPSDVFLLLETFGAKLTIVHKNGTEPKILSPAEFLDLDMNGRVITKITFYPLQGQHVYRTFKVMPRAQNAYAIVNAGFLITLNDDVNTITKATLVYGAINSDFVHATKTEQFLIGKKLFDDSTLQQAYKILDEELDTDIAQPDPSPETRKKLAISLFYKFVLSVAPDNLVNPLYKSGGQKFDRPVSSARQDYQTNKSLYPLTQPIPKVEALVQCSGEGRYVVDFDVTRPDYLFGAFFLARSLAGSTITKIDTDEVMKIPGVITIVTSKDIPGRNSFITPELLLPNSEEVFCSGDVKYNGQPVGLILAETEDIAYRAAQLIHLEYTNENKDRKYSYTIRDALKIPNNSRIVLDKEHKSTAKGNDIKKVFKGTFDIGSQYHYTMETQACVCIPIEDGMDVHASSQWMDINQIGIAKCCDIPVNNVNVYVRRIGGGYGSKIIRSNLIICACAIAAKITNRPVYIRMRLEDNMDVVGKRFPFSSDYEVGVNDDGKIQYLNLSLWMNYGYTTNETVLRAALEHTFNCYDTSTWDIKAYGVTTDTPPNTYARAPGSTEGIGLIESIMEHIAIELKKDPAQVRLQNMAPIDNPLPALMLDFGKGAKIDERKRKVDEFNKNNRWRKRGIGVTVMNYPFEYLGNFHAMVSIYSGDGTVSITHGGIEMGQGINTKVQQVAAHVLGIDINMIQIKPSNNLTAPNNFITGGSAGSESVCYATMEACKILLERMEPVKKKMDSYNWLHMIQKSRSLGIDLCATYQFTLMDNVKNYRIFGVTYAEVEVDLLTGIMQIERVDLLEDTGESMSPEVDIGQVEGAFTMGLGYWLMEQIKYDETDGKLLNNRTWTYHIPGMKDIPIDWRIEFRKNAPNPVGVLRSKATGEPSLAMSIVVPLAIRQALAVARLESNPKINPWFSIDGPTTTDTIMENALPNYSQYKLK